MSRVGKAIIDIPQGVSIDVKGDQVDIRGPKGTLRTSLPRGFSAVLKENDIRIEPKSVPSRRNKAMWGTTRMILANAVKGVSLGFEKRLLLEGIGIRAALQGSNLALSLGFSHPVTIEPPEGISFAVEKNIVTVSGINKELVGAVAASIRELKKAEPYKGAGIRYEGEIIRRKAGKKAATAAK